MSKMYIPQDMREKFIKPLEEIAYHNHCSVRDVFYDWVTCSALAASGFLMTQAGQSDVGYARLDRSDAIVKKYKHEDFNTILLLSETLRNELHENPRDILGDLYMRLRASNSCLGQVFTPFHVSELMSRLVWSDENGSLDVNDCCCGSGAMLIAHHKTVLSKGYTASNYNCIAQDIDEFCCMMAFLQMELLGMSAIVYNDDSLARPFGPNMEISKMYVTTRYFVNDYGAKHAEEHKSA